MISIDIYLEVHLVSRNANTIHNDQGPYRGIMPLLNKIYQTNCRLMFNLNTSAVQEEIVTR